jgi:hypothetical protein
MARPVRRAHRDLRAFKASRGCRGSRVPKDRRVPPGHLEHKADRGRLGLPGPPELPDLLVLKEFKEYLDHKAPRGLQAPTPTPMPA